MSFRNVLLTCLMMAALVMHAQTTIDTLVSKEEPAQDDKYATEVPKDSPPYKGHTAVSRQDIPPRLLKTLNNDDLYKGWESNNLYLDENTHLYVLRMKHENTITTYGFTKRGKAATYDSYIKKE